MHNKPVVDQVAGESTVNKRRMPLRLPRLKLMRRDIAPLSKVYRTNLTTRGRGRANSTINSVKPPRMAHTVYLVYGAQAAAAQWAASFKDFPPVQKPNTFTLDDALKKMHETASGMH
jgi:hypothetical protein